MGNEGSVTPLIAGFFAPWLIAAGVLVLQALLPARRVVGYARDEPSGEPLRYRLNGVAVFCTTILAWLAAGHLGVMPWDWLWTHRWSGLVGGCTLGIVATGIAVFSAPPGGRSVTAAFFFGRRANPRLINGRVDAKMFLYVFGATLLELNLLSFLAHHWAGFPAPSPGVLLYVALFTWFVADYLVFERVHLYTYDLVAERVGFKLIWGCVAFYPYCYAVGLWAVADRPDPQAPAWLYALATVCFFAGWTLARGSNMQKYTFKLDPERVFLGVLAPRSITDGARHVLCSGFWGVSRHVNYLGELLMAIGLTLALGRPELIWPWLYPLYYLLLLVPRERDDDRRCAGKYGALWEAYRERVPWRIVPGVY